MSELAATVAKSSLALEELLQADGRVVFENIFSTRHLGRIIDFFLYEGRRFLDASTDPGYSEYRVRNILELAIFNGWSNYRRGEKSKCVEVECGWDKQRFIVSTSFYAAEDASGFVPGQNEKPKNAASARMYKMFLQIQALSDGLIVRHETRSGRVQLIAFISAKDGDKVTETRYVDLEKIETRSEAQQNAAVVPTPLSASGVDDFIADEKADERKRPVSGGAQIKDDFDTQLKHLHGAAEKDNDKVFKIKSGSSDAGSEMFVVKSQGGAPGPVESEDDGDALDTSHTEESVQVLISTVQTEVMPLCTGLDNAQFQEAFRSMADKIRENYNQTLHHLMRVKNIQMISKVKNYKDQVSVLTSRMEALQNELNKPQADAKGDSSTGLVVGMPGGAEDQEWANKLKSEVAKERGEMNKKLHEWEAKTRKTEYDFKSKETGLKEQLRINEEHLRQKDFSLKKTKEALANSLAILEKNRTTMSLGNAGKNELVNKLSTVERLLSIAKDSNERMQKRLDDVQKKWQEEFNERAASQKECSGLKRKIDDLTRKTTGPGQLTSDEAMKLVGERDRANKMIDEFRRQNRELNDKLTVSMTAAKNAAANAEAGGAKKPGARGGPSDSELKHKLEHSNKVLRSTKDDFDRLKKRYDDLKLEETKLRVEVGKLQSQLKVAAKGGTVVDPSKPKPRGPSGGGHIPPKSGTGTPKPTK